MHNFPDLLKRDRKNALPFHSPKSHFWKEKSKVAHFVAELVVLFARNNQE